LRVVVDSSVWISLFRDDDLPIVSVFRALLTEAVILVGDVVMLELLLGARSEPDARRIETQLRRYKIVDMLNADMAAKAAANYRTLRSIGVTIRKTNDLVIGTYCIEHGYELLHRDRDFDAMEKHLGLRALAS
jgi:predicted nucleic acid-binding protein